MKHGDRLKDGRYRWRCRIKDTETQRRFRARKIAAGYCVVCMVDPATWGSLCESCRARGLVYNYNKTIEKYSKLNALDKDDPEYIAIVRKDLIHG